MGAINTVLIVDDSALDRQLAGGLLEKESGISVRYASSAAEAFESLNQCAPDLIVTDLVMPETSGLELVAEVKRRSPLLPVVVITSAGTDQTALDALRAGAASYVPKQILSSYLAETVRDVLAVSVRERGKERLLNTMHRLQCEFVLENDRSLVPPLVTYLQEAMLSLGVCTDAEQTHLGIALEEAVVNALYHGNLEISSELRESDYDGYYALVEQRRVLSPYAERRIYIEAQLTRHQAVFSIRDEGPGFNPGEVPDPTDPANWDRVSGRGLLLMRTFMDDVAHNKLGNVVTMTKRAGARQPVPN